MTIMDITAFLTNHRPSVTVVLVLLVVAASATYLLVRNRLRVHPGSSGAFSRKSLKKSNSRKEGPISLGIRRAVNEFMRN